MEMITLLSQHLICSRCRSVSENTSQEVPMENQRRRKKLFGRSKNNDNQPMEAQIAFVEDENIYIEPISKALLNEIIV